MTPDELENAVAGLSHEELARFREWFVEFDSAARDCQLKRGAQAGKLECSVLRASGPYEPLHQSVDASPFTFTESVAARKRREAGLSDSWTTFNLTVSDANGNEVPVQTRESERFLSQNLDDLQKLRTSAGVEQLTLDFAWDFPSSSAGQYNTFPSSLLKMCGALGIDIEVSVYHVNSED